MEKRYLTKEKLEKLKEELNYLKTVKRKEIAERISYTASFGDLSENFAYQQAKDDQGALERRIKELETIITQAEIVQKKESSEIGIGSIVLIEELGKNSKKEKFQIVDPAEANPFENKISFQSPLGKELIGKTVGKKIKLKTPDGVLEYKIVGIE